MASSKLFPKVIILAAGQSKRMDPLPDKNFIEFCGKPLLAWQIDQLIAAGFSDIAVIGGRHNLDELEKVRRGDSVENGKKPQKKAKLYKKSKLFFEILEQKKLEEGMAGAVLTAEKWIGDDAFLVVSSNDIVESSIFAALAKAMKEKKSASGLLVAKKVTSYFPGGYLKVVKDGSQKGRIEGIVEKPGAGNEPSDLVNLVFHFHREPKKLFAALKKVETSRDDRYEVALDTLIKSGAPFFAVPYAGSWQAVKYPWHLLSVWQALFATLMRGEKNAQKPKISKKAVIAKSAIIRGAVIIEDGVKVFDHAVIQGPAYIGKNCIIANNSLVRDSHLGAGSVAGFGTEIARSFLGNNVWTHTNYIGDSVIGSNTSFGSGTVTGNLRLDEKSIPVNIGASGDGVTKIDSGMNKLGAIIGEGVRVGINVSLMPGIKIGNNCFIGGGISVAQDIPDSKFVYGKWELTIRDNIAKMDPSAREKMMQRLKNS